MKTTLANRRARRRGSFVVEGALAWGILMAMALLLLKFQTNATRSQQWTIMQSLTDARIGQEQALAARVPFNDIVAAETLWPTYPSMSRSNVVVGRLPGGRDVEVSLVRTKKPAADNLPSATGSTSSTTNPAGMEAWQVVSVLNYQIGGRDYVKSRTTLRIR